MAAVAALALVGTAACSNGGSNSSSSSSEKIPSKITKKTTVVFWNAMPGVQGSTLKQLTNEFEKKNPKINVKLENQGAYNDLQAKMQGHKKFSLASFRLGVHKTTTCMERPPDKAARRLQALASAGCDPKQNCLGNSHWNEFAKVVKRRLFHLME